MPYYLKVASIFLLSIRLQATENPTKYTVAIDDVPDYNHFANFLENDDFKAFFHSKEFNRPSKCPLKSENFSDIVDKLILIKEGLINGPCANKQQPLATGLDDIANKIYALGNGSTTVPTGDPSLTFGTRVQSLLNNMALLHRDSVCIQDIKEKGLLPIIADVATTVGQLSLIAPLPNLILIGGAAITLGTTIKVLNNLFASPFDWSLQRDRKQFLDLNCSFFNLRRDMDQMGIFDLPGESTRQNIELGTRLAIQIEAWQKEYTSGFTAVLAQIGDVEPDSDLDDDSMKKFTTQIDKLKEKILSFKIALDNSYNETKQQLNKRLEILKAIQTKLDMDPYSNGAQAHFDILQEYKKSQKLIFGRRGWEFLKFLLKGAKNDLHHFKTGYKFWLKKKEIAKPGSEFDLKWLCRDARQLRDDWESANYSFETSVDFLETNRGLFHRNVKRYRWLVNIIPLGSSTNFHLYRNMMAMELARAALLPTPNITDMQVQEIKKLHNREKHNVGLIAIKVKTLFPVRLEIDQFIQSNKCLDFL